MSPEKCLEDRAGFYCLWGGVLFTLSGSCGLPLHQEWLLEATLQDICNREELDLVGASLCKTGGQWAVVGAVNAHAPPHPKHEYSVARAITFATQCTNLG